MVVRQRRKKNTLRGHRTHGKGNTKNKRGKGSKGGKGRAGSHKHKFSKYYMTFGIKIRLKPKKGQDKAINLGDLNELLPQFLEKQQAIKKENRILIDSQSFPYNKILGKGNTRIAIEVKGITVTENAKKKIEASGGKIE
ncbi:MAG: uL15m family ribosomal protein [archaeon]|nr:uL15m family ribosomal protein [archaeon]